MVLAPPKSAQEYYAELSRTLSWAEKITDALSGKDERIDVTNRLLIEVVRLLSRPRLAPSPIFGVPPYNVRKFELDTARPRGDPQEVQLSGDALTFYTDAPYSEIEFALDDPTNDWITVGHFGNPYNYPARFQKFYLSWSSQPGKVLEIHIGREAGAAAGTQISVAEVITQTDFITNQVSVGTSAVQLQSSSFSLKMGGVVVKADDGNGGNIYVGKSDVTTSTGFRLKAGQGVVFEVDNINKVYVIASLAGQKVHYLGI